MPFRPAFWFRLALTNLGFVALLGVTMRSKFVFEMPWIDYRSVLGAHSNFAFSGWVGLMLSILLVWELLPAARRKDAFYNRIFWGMQLSALGTAIAYLVEGNGSWARGFTMLTMVVALVFTIRFLLHLRGLPLPRITRLLTGVALLSQIVSFTGPVVMAWMQATGSHNSVLHRDMIYTYLHFQYNGFFTLGILALFTRQVAAEPGGLPRSLRLAATGLCLALLPALFLSLLWHNNPVFFALGAIGAVFEMTAFVFLAIFLLGRRPSGQPVARLLEFLSLGSLALKLLLHSGTLIPWLGHAVYGDRPVIIGFLHLVFLAFVSFYFLRHLLANGWLVSSTRTRTALLVFCGGVIITESLLGLQGLSILLNSNDRIYAWLLWGASIMLFAGSVLLPLMPLHEEDPGNENAGPEVRH